MNREGAETFLRLVAEAEMRSLLASAPAPWPGRPGRGRSKVMVVGQALTAVGVLETDTVQDILADFDLAVSLRQLHAQPGTTRNHITRNRATRGPATRNRATRGPATRGPATWGYATRGHASRTLATRTMRAAAAVRLAAQIQVGHSGPPTQLARLAGNWSAGSSGSPDRRTRAARSRPGSWGGRPVRPGRADDPVSRREHQRRSVPYVVRAHRLGGAIHRGVGDPHPVGSSFGLGLAAPRPDSRSGSSP